MSVCVFVQSVVVGEGGVGWVGRGGHKDITESYRGDQVNLSWKNQNPPTHPSPPDDEWWQAHI